MVWFYGNLFLYVGVSMTLFEPKQQPTEPSITGGGFLESYFELKAVEATPNRWNLLKAGFLAAETPRKILFPQETRTRWTKYGKSRGSPKTKQKRSGIRR